MHTKTPLGKFITALLLYNNVLDQAGANDPPDTAGHAPSLHEYIEIQNNIGWYSLLLGYIPTALFESITYDVKVSRKTWISRIIDALYQYHLDIWTFRNTVAHDPSIDQLDTVHLRLYQSVLSWYDRCHELTPAGRSLLPEDPNTLQNYSILALSELHEHINNFHLLWTRKPRSRKIFANSSPVFSTYKAQPRPTLALRFIWLCPQ
jgi:hypothetical protein